MFDTAVAWLGGAVRRRGRGPTRVFHMPLRTSHWTHRVIAALVACALASGRLAVSAVAVPVERTFVATADAKVSLAKPAKAFGTTADLRARSGSSAWQSFLRFSVSGAGSVTAARLRLFVAEPSSSSGSVHLTGGGWSEPSITWNTAPLIGAQVGPAVPAQTVGGWIEIGLGAAVGGDGTYDLAVVSAVSDSVSFSSHEGAHPPELVVTTEGVGGSGTPVAAFAAQPLGGLAPLGVAFTDLSGFAPSSWAWDFEADGAVDSTEQHPRFTYATAGIYSVTLTAGSTGGVDSETKPSYINVAAGPTGETAPVPSSGDAADDPAIWVDTADPGRSTVIGTDKVGGIAVYDLDGKQLQYRSDGLINNVDARPGFALGGANVTIVAASNRTLKTIAVYRVEPTTRLLVEVSARPITTNRSFSGICLYHSAVSGKLYAFTARAASTGLGDVEQWELFDNGAGLVDGRFVRTFAVGSATEACVADDELGWFYVSEEAVGIWRYGAEPGAGTDRTHVDGTGPAGHLVADVEGLAVAGQPGGTGYLIASSQGDDTFAVYRRSPPHAFVKRFVIGQAGGIDGVSNTDGIDVAPVPLGALYPRGLLVVQDGSNDGANQNFKLVPLQVVIG